MSCGIDEILLRLKGTREYEILSGIKEIYYSLEKCQNEWYARTEFTCPAGCGKCCHNFEPDLSEAEALYLAAWLLQNQTDKAYSIGDGTFTYSPETTCILFDNENSYHCTCYNGRAFICRLFGGSCVKDKNGFPCWRPCKFYPDSRLASHKPPIFHREYDMEETMQLFGTLPPVMSDVTAQALGFTPENEKTEPLRKILPEKIRLLVTILSFLESTPA